MSAPDQTPLTSISPAELQDIVKVFADSDLRELRLSVGAVDLLVSRNEQVDVPPARAATAPAPPVQQSRAPETVPDATPAPGTAAQSAPQPAPAEAAATPAGPPREGLREILSPALGTFYRRPAPDKAPFVEVGTKVEVGDSVGTIEVMKMFTTVTAEVAGTVTEICVDDAVLVEHGQRLYFVDPAGS